ncbi:retrovirus-related pol polyprotein from transposon TNT 1-94 [Tanacetum coccineum]
MTPHQKPQDLVQGNFTVKGVYYVEGLNHNLFYVGQFCDADLELFKNLLQQLQFASWLKLHRLKHGYGIVRTVRTDKGTEFLNKTLQTYFQEEGIHHQTKIARTPKQNSIFKRRNRILVEAARTKRSDSKLPLFIWEEVIATAFKDGENLDKMKEKGDQLIFVGYSAQSKGYRVYNNRTRMIVESIHINFDELKKVMTFDDNTSGLIPQRQMASDYDNSGSAPQLQQTFVHNSTKLRIQDHNNEPSKPSTPTTNVNAEENNNNQAVNAHFYVDKFFNPLCTLVHEVAKSSLRNVDPSNMYEFYQRHCSDYHWMKDHPLEQVRRNPSMIVQTRRQLVTDLEMCMFALTMSKVEPKNIKEATADHAWIEVMQEELHQFNRIGV